MMRVDTEVLDLQRGYEELEQGFACLFCDQAYLKGEVFQVGERFFTAELRMKIHLTEDHQSAFHALLALDKKDTGLSDVQKELLTLFYEGHDDKEVMKRSTANSVSTIRQHRFKLREKERQAKVFLAIMQNLQMHQNYVEVHKGATQVDERYAITAAETDKVLTTYFKDGLDGKVETIPSKEKRKIILLQHIIKRFQANKQYSEKEMNEVLKGVHDDYVSLRRYLIEYGFFDRNKDGSLYWMKS